MTVISPEGAFDWLSETGASTTGMPASSSRSAIEIVARRHGGAKQEDGKLVLTPGRLTRHPAVHVRAL
jgi:hypothetical protein